MIKDEEMKKSILNMQNMKSSLVQLEEAVETYQGYAEEKGKENDLLNERLKEKEAKIAELETVVKVMKEQIEKLVANGGSTNNRQVEQKKTNGSGFFPSLFGTTTSKQQ